MSEAVDIVMGFQDTLDELAKRKDLDKRFRGIVADFIKHVWRTDKMEEWLSPNFLDAVIEGLEAYIDEKVNRIPIPTDNKATFTGEVVTMKMSSGQFAAMKMLVLTDSGNKLWGKIPEDLIPVLKKGNRVEVLQCRVKPSPDDPHFGFFSHVKGVNIVV